MDNSILYYNLSEGVEAFSTMRDAVLPYYVVTPHQVHGYKVAKIVDPATPRDELEGYDALITNVVGCAIGVRSADCVPVLLYDPVKRAVAAIHSGWKGTVQKISQKTIIQMMRDFGTKPEDLLAVMGPGISKPYFQVGNEVVQFFKESFFPLEDIWSFDGVSKEGSLEGGHHIDLVKANKWLLTEFGVPEDHILCCGICSYSDSRFFSARREGFECGRTINSIKLI